jgi:hypothetical protein
MTHPILSRILMHQRRSTSTAAIIGTLTVFALLEYHVLVEHRIPWDLIAVIYAMGATKIALMLWYRFKN